MSKKGQAKIQEAMSRFLELMDSADLPEMIARSYIKPVKEGGIPSDRWSLTNRLIMILHGHTAAAGFRQWEKRGRTVKKGQRAFYILAPCTRRVEEEIEKISPDGRTITRTEKKVIVSGFRGIPVFGYEQTEGDPVDLPSYGPPELPPLAEVADAFGLEVRYEPKYGSAYGSYSPNRDTVLLHTHEPCTWWHELGHAAHYRVEQLESTAGQDPYKELVAETVAGVLCCFYQEEQYIPKVKQYLQSYSEGRDVTRAVANVISTVEKCLQKILSISAPRSQSRICPLPYSDMERNDRVRFH